MKSSQITVTNKDNGVSEALAMTEKTGAYLELDKRSILHLRLLAEELFGLLRGIAGDVEANYWIEAEGKNVELHMTSEVKMTDEIRDQLLASASSGKNSAASSFMGKIRVMIADILVSSHEVLPYAMINTVSSYPMGAAVSATSSVWSLNLYRDDVKQHLDDSKEASDAWDELEKSIVANIADDVKVSIVGKNVGITVYKAF